MLYRRKPRKVYDCSLPTIQTKQSSRVWGLSIRYKRIIDTAKWKWLHHYITQTKNHNKNKGEKKNTEYTRNAGLTTEEKCGEIIRKSQFPKNLFGGK